MSDPTESPASGRAERITLRDSIDGVRVSQALVDNAGELRAAAIYARNLQQTPNAVVHDATLIAMDNIQRNRPSTASAWERINEPPPVQPPLVMLRRQQMETPPQEYVVHYYAWDNAAEPKPERAGNVFSRHYQDTITQLTSKGPETKKVPFVRADNPMQPIDSAMRKDVSEAFATIAAQLPGRFRFVEVHDPAQADIQIAAVAKSEQMSGVAHTSSGSVLLNASYYMEVAKKAASVDPNNDRASTEIVFHRDTCRHVVLHELLHALGLAHPHDPGVDITRTKPVIDLVTYRDSQMTYDANDHRANPLNEVQRPLSLMPADIEALMMLYPLPHDRTAAMVGNAAGVRERPDVGAIVTGSSARSVALPDSGMVYQPAPDTDHDVVQLRASTDPAYNHRFTSYGEKVVWPATVALEQDANGVMIGDWRGTHGKDYFHSSAYLQFSPEEIRTSPGRDRISIENAASIHVENNTYPGMSDLILLRGSGNHVSLPADGKTLIYLRGDDYHFTIRNRGVENIKMPYIVVDNATAFTGNFRYWAAEEHGRFNATVTSVDGRTNMSMTFALEDPSPQALQQVEEWMKVQFSNTSLRGGTFVMPRMSMLGQPLAAEDPALSPAAIRQMLGIPGEPYVWESPLQNLPVNPPPFTAQPAPENAEGQEARTRDNSARTNGPRR